MLSDIIRVEVVIDAVRVGGAYGGDLGRGGAYRRDSGYYRG